MNAKSNAQHGRRTPLSLSAAAKQQQQQNQQHHNKTASGTNGNSNASHKNDNRNTTHQKPEEPTLAELKETIQKESKKQQQQQQTVEKKQQPQQQQNEAPKKNVERNEEKKSQNGNVAKSNVNTKEKQQQQQQNKEVDIKEVAKEKKETPETLDKNEKVLKTEMPAAKEEKKDKEDNKEKKDAVEQPEKSNEKKPEKEVTKPERKKSQPEKSDVEKMDISNSEEKTPAAAAPVTPKKATVEPKQATNKSTPTKAAEKKVPTPIKSTTTVIDISDDVEMEDLKVVDNSPIKRIANTEPIAPTVTTIKPTINPAATSTPGKLLSANKRSAPKSEVKLTMQTGSSPDRSSCPRSFSQISGRRSIRPISDYASSQFQNNLYFRESYRRINTELDVTSTTNTSLNVTVGSEVPNNSSFSFFGRGRKRDRTPPLMSRSTIELQTDVDLSPPKRARLDMQSFLNVVASPLTLLRSRFAKTNIQSSTPMKLGTKLAAEEEEESEVQNVSGISIHEEILNGEGGEDVTATGEEAAAATDETAKKELSANVEEVDNKSGATDQPDMLPGVGEKCALEQATTTDTTDNSDANDDIKIKETPLVGAVGDPLAKNKRCSIM